jgi:hypothetical protein
MYLASSFSLAHTSPGPMDEPLILYSANTWLAYAIAERFYGGMHYAWCSPVYDGTTAARHVNIPPSSSPAEIYRALLEDSRRGERHSRLFVDKVKGVQRGVQQKMETGAITIDEAEEILKMLQGAQPGELRPVLYVIPYDAVRDRVADVPPAERAHPFSIEYRIYELPRSCFDVLELWR